MCLNVLTVPPVMRHLRHIPANHFPARLSWVYAVTRSFATRKYVVVKLRGREATGGTRRYSGGV